MSHDSERTSNGDAPRLTIGVLAVQGDFAEHAAMLKRADASVAVREVRTPRDLLGLEGLIVPGGESTTIGKLAALYGLDEAIRRFNAEEGRPVYGTCAGMIYVARDAGRPQPVLSHHRSNVRRSRSGQRYRS